MSPNTNPVASLEALIEKINSYIAIAPNLTPTDISHLATATLDLANATRSLGLVK